MPVALWQSSHRFESFLHRLNEFRDRQVAEIACGEPSVQEQSKIFGRYAVSNEWRCLLDDVGYQPIFRGVAEFPKESPSSQGGIADYVAIARLDPRCTWKMGLIQPIPQPGRRRPQD